MSRISVPNGCGNLDGDSMSIPPGYVAADEMGIPPIGEMLFVPPGCFAGNEMSLPPGARIGPPTDVCAL